MKSTFSFLINSYAYLTATEIKSFADLKIYPIPASEVLNVSVGTDEKISASVLSITGESVAEFSFEGQIEIPLTNLSKGVHVIRLTSAKGSVIRRFIVE